MKKILSLLLVLTLAASLCVCAAAAGFVSSPSGKTLPNVKVIPSDPDVEVTVFEDPTGEVSALVFEKDGCKDALVITPYSAKNGMPGNIEDHNWDGTEGNISRAGANQQQLEAAYTQLVGLSSFANLPGITSGFQSELSAAAINAGTTIDKLVVSDLFDISYYHISQAAVGHVGDDHQEIYTIEMDEETIESFVALLHQPMAHKNDQRWEIVPVTLNRQARTISFAIDVNDLSPFAIVVFSDHSGPVGPDGPGGDIRSPKTADPVSFVELGMAMAASVGGLVVLGKRKHD